MVPSQVGVGVGQARVRQSHIVIRSVVILTFRVATVRWCSFEGRKDYAPTLLGLIVFNAFAECLKKGPVIISDNPNFMKKVV